MPAAYQLNELFLAHSSLKISEVIGSGRIFVFAPQASYQPPLYEQKCSQDLNNIVILISERAYSPRHDTASKVSESPGGAVPISH